jgi:hypothetical protein
MLAPPASHAIEFRLPVTKMVVNAILNLLRPLYAPFMAFTNYPCAPIWELWFNLYFQTVLVILMVAIVLERGKTLAEMVFPVSK